MNSKYSIAIYVFYFGKWPEWFELYFDSIKRNSSIDFHIFTDCDTSLTADNVFYHKYSFDQYKTLVSGRLKLEFNPNNGIKICDVRPFIGLLHSDVFNKYDYYGWADVDLLFGNIRQFYTDELLLKYNVFATRTNKTAGHFTLFKNTKTNREICFKIYKWREALQNPDFVGLDEHGITNALSMTFFDKLNEKMGWNTDILFTRWLSRLKRRKLYLVEKYTTPFTPIPWLDGTVNSDQPSIWYYDNGVITNDRDKDRKFIYIHFMNFKSSKWRHDGTVAPWENLNSIYKVENIKDKVVICNDGIKNLLYS